MTDDFLITMKHVRANQMCSGGSRKFCERHGIDWNKFLSEGIMASELMKIDDAMVRDLVEKSRGRI